MIAEFGLFVVLTFTTLDDCEAIKDMMHRTTNAQCFMSYRNLDTHPYQVIIVYISMT